MYLDKYANSRKIAKYIWLHLERKTERNIFNIEDLKNYLGWIPNFNFCLQA